MHFMNVHTSKVIDMSNMFSNCSLLNVLPDISKWNTNSLKNINCMFKYCSNLSFLPDISKWNTNNIREMDSFLYGCSSLISYPDISKWKINIQKDIFNLNNDDIDGSKSENLTLSSIQNNSTFESKSSSHNSFSNEENEKVFNQDYKIIENINTFYNEEKNIDEYYENFYN